MKTTPLFQVFAVLAITLLGSSAAQAQADITLPADKIPLKKYASLARNGSWVDTRTYGAGEFTMVFASSYDIQAASFAPSATQTTAFSKYLPSLTTSDESDGFALAEIAIGLPNVAFTKSTSFSCGLRRIPNLTGTASTSAMVIKSCPTLPGKLGKTWKLIEGNGHWVRSFSSTISNTAQTFGFSVTSANRYFFGEVKSNSTFPISVIKAADVAKWNAKQAVTPLATFTAGADYRQLTNLVPSDYAVVVRSTASGNFISVMFIDEYQ